MPPINQPSQGSAPPSSQPQSTQPSAGTTGAAANSAAQQGGPNAHSGATTFQGTAVRIVRNAQQGDPDFAPAKGEQVIIKLEDGTQRTVLRSDLTG